jgi:sarcosine oxidase subunit delta
MRIPCPFCGDRVHSEFLYLGDAGPVRPKAAERGALPDATLFHDYVHIRDNPAGMHREYWQHSGGCRAWLVVERDVTTHAIGRVEPASAANHSGSARR